MEVKMAQAEHFDALVLGSGQGGKIDARNRLLAMAELAPAPAKAAHPLSLCEAGDPALPSIAFGPFRLYPRQRLLLEEDKPLRLGSRALDILIALVERPGELVSKRELIAWVWPGIVVEEDNVKTHIRALRRMLRDGQLGSRYICTVPGRGYSFVARVVRSEGPLPDDTASQLQELPTSSMSSIGVGDLVEGLAAELSQQRFVSVVGAGNMARALFLAAALMADYRHGVCFIDLAHFSDPLHIPSAVGTAIGLDVGCCDPLARITATLKDKNMLLVLDNCGHVLGAAAALADSVLESAPGVQILAIGR
jgi:DNA-binding winged helix-turn-helix (wHTH) protein